LLDIVTSLRHVELRSRRGG